MNGKLHLINRKKELTDNGESPLKSVGSFHMNKLNVAKTLPRGYHKTRKPLVLLDSCSRFYYSHSAKSTVFNFVFDALQGVCYLDYTVFNLILLACGFFSIKIVSAFSLSQFAIPPRRFWFVSDIS